MHTHTRVARRVYVLLIHIAYIVIYLLYTLDGAWILVSANGAAHNEYAHEVAA